MPAHLCPQAPVHMPVAFATTRPCSCPRTSARIWRETARVDPDTTVTTRPGVTAAVVADAIVYWRNFYSSPVQAGSANPTRRRLGHVLASPQSIPRRHPYLHQRATSTHEPTPFADIRARRHTPARPNDPPAGPTPAPQSNP